MVRQSVVGFSVLRFVLVFLLTHFKRSSNLSALRKNARTQTVVLKALIQISVWLVVNAGLVKQVGALNG